MYRCMKLTTFLSRIGGMDLLLGLRVGLLGCHNEMVVPTHRSSSSAMVASKSIWSLLADFTE